MVVEVVHGTYDVVIPAVRTAMRRWGGVAMVYDSQVC